MMNATDHDHDHDDEVRYGLTPLGREALAEAITEAVSGMAPAPMGGSAEPAGLPLRRIRRTRTRVRALVRAAGRRS